MFLEMLLGGSVLILVLALVRAVLGSRMGAGLRYGLWLLALLRLLVPVSFGQLALSPANLARATEDALYLAPIYSGPPQGAGVTVTEDGAVGDPNSFGYTQPNQDGTVTRYGVKQTVSRALPWIWRGGMTLTAVWFLLCNLLFYRDLRKTRRLLRHIGKRPVYVAETPSPCLFGRSIYVTPAVAADETMLRHVLTHERVHLHHGDHIWAFFRTVCLVVWWFDPLVWLAADLSRRDCELCCDEAVIRLLGEDRRTEYGKTLLALAGGKKGSAAAFCAASTLSGTGRSLKRRIRAIAAWAKPKTWAVLAAAVLALPAAACAFSGGKEPLAPPPALEAPSIAENEYPPEALPTEAVYEVPDYEALFARLAQEPEDEALFRQLAADYPAAQEHCVDYLLSHPGCLEGLSWEDAGLPAVLFRFFNDTKPLSIGMDLATDTLGEYWDEYVDLACRAHPDPVPPAEETYLLWYIAQAAGPRPASWIDEKLTNIDGLELGMTVDQAERETDVAGVHPWQELETGPGQRTFVYDGMDFTFTLAGGDYRLTGIANQGVPSAARPLCVKGDIGESLAAILSRYGAAVPPAGEAEHTFYGEKDRPYSATLFRAGGLCRLHILGGSSQVTLWFDEDDCLEAFNGMGF